MRNDQGGHIDAVATEPRCQRGRIFCGSYILRRPFASRQPSTNALLCKSSPLAIVGRPLCRGSSPSRTRSPGKPSFSTSSTRNQTLKVLPVTSMVTGALPPPLARCHYQSRGRNGIVAWSDLSSSRDDRACAPELAIVVAADSARERAALSASVTRSEPPRCDSNLASADFRLVDGRRSLPYI